MTCPASGGAHEEFTIVADAPTGPHVCNVLCDEEGHVSVLYFDCDLGDYSRPDVLAELNAELARRGAFGVRVVDITPAMEAPPLDGVFRWPWLVRTVREDRP